MNTTTPTEGSDNISAPTQCQNGCQCRRGHEDSYYTELIRIIAGLFVGLLAIMTFLLTVGFQRPHAVFAWALYVSIVTLALNLIGYVFGHIFQTEARSRRRAFKHATVEGKELEALKASCESAHKRLKVVRVVQQVLFMAAVVAISILALSAANFFFTVPAQSAAPAQQ